MEALVLTVIGPDRPGLVESVSRAVADHGGNWLESRMARLGGQFAGILRVEVPAERADALASALDALSSGGLRVQAVRDAASGATTSESKLVQLELVGGDRPGIVRELSKTLAALGVNVDQLETERTGAPLSGGELFRANALLQIPPGVEIDTLRRRLEAIAGDLMVDITLHG
jgi:glycine cleavage system regulatory protein